MQDNIRKITAYLFTLKFLGLFVSLFVLSLSAKYFGVSEDRDVWILVTSFFIAISGAVFGPLNETFRAKFTHLYETESKEALNVKLNSLVGFIIVLAVVLSLIIFLCPKYIMEIIAPSLKDGAMFHKMLIVLIPTLFINQLIYLGTGILNIYDVFYLPEIIGFFSGIINLICIFLLTPSIGIYSLIVSQYIYLFIYLLVVLYFLYKKDVIIKPILFFNWKDVKPFVLFSLPFFFPYFVGQCNLILEKSLASTLGQGIVSILDYSRRFSTILQTVLTSVLASVMVTKLTQLFSQGKNHKYSDAHYKFLEITNLILCIGLPILIGSASIVSRLFFKRGDITELDINRISLLMQLYCFSFIGVAFYLFFGLTLLSQMKGKIYALLGVSSQILVMVINVFFYKNMREYTFPISVGIGHTLCAVLMCFFIVNENKKQEFNLILKSVFFIILATIIIYYQNSVLVNVDLILHLLINIVTLFILSSIILLPMMKINIFKLLNEWRKKI